MSLRWMLVVLLVGRIAAAEILMEEPPIARRCKRSDSWPHMMACLKHLGEPTVVRQEGAAKLVHVKKEMIDYGLNLFVLRDGAWQLAGGVGSSEDVVGMSAISVGNLTGYRIDLRSAVAYSVALDDGTRIPGVLATQQQALCSATSCTTIVTACDIYVDGRSYRTFRGVVQLDGKLVHVRGDRSKAGECSPPENTIWHD